VELAKRDMSAPTPKRRKVRAPLQKKQPPLFRQNAQGDLEDYKENTRTLSQSGFFAPSQEIIWNDPSFEEDAVEHEEGIDLVPYNAMKDKIFIDLTELSDFDK
jgi:hypothetical protein